MRRWMTDCALWPAVSGDSPNDFWIAGYFREKPSMPAKNRQSVTTRISGLVIQWPPDGRVSTAVRHFEDAVRLRRA